MWSYLLSYVYYSGIISRDDDDKERLLLEKKDYHLVEEDDFLKLGGMITVNDLKSVNLHPVKPLTAIHYYPKVDLRNLNKDQLTSILNVKLRPIPTNNNNNNNIKRIYEVRHPCLRELLKRRAVIN